MGYKKKIILFLQNFQKYLEFLDGTQFVIRIDFRIFFVYTRYFCKQNFYRYFYCDSL